VTSAAYRSSSTSSRTSAVTYSSAARGSGSSAPSRRDRAPRSAPGSRRPRASPERAAPTRTRRRAGRPAGSRAGVERQVREQATGEAQPGPERGLRVRISPVYVQGGELAQRRGDALRGGLGSQIAEASHASDGIQRR
jgi:hypothetical protein